MSKRISEAPCIGDYAVCVAGCPHKYIGKHCFESCGGKKAWAERFELLDGMNNDEVEALSLIRVREAGGERRNGRMSSG